VCFFGKEMSGVDVDIGEQSEWRDVLETLGGLPGLRPEIDKGLLLARECRHPDAQWLTLYLAVPCWQSDK
jgi:hypothetical protein